jgi:hypothetical protein
MSVVAFIHPAHAKDVTHLVKTQLHLDEEVAKACRIYCQGNRRQGILQRVSASPTQNSTYEITAVLDFKNHHYVETAPSSGFSLFNYTVRIIAKGLLDSRTCQVKLDDISINNDRLGLADAFKTEKGKIYQVPDCQKFL